MCRTNYLRFNRKPPPDAMPCQAPSGGHSGSCRRCQTETGLERDGALTMAILMYVNEHRLLGANSTNLRHLNCSFLMCWTFFSKVPILASNLLHVSHFNVDDPKGNRCGTIQTKHHHHSHLIQNSMKLDICCSSILSGLGGSIKAFLFSIHWVPSHVSTPWRGFISTPALPKALKLVFWRLPVSCCGWIFLLWEWGHSSPNWR